MLIMLLMFFKKWACYICMVGGMIVKHAFFMALKFLKRIGFWIFFKCYVEFSLIHTGSKEYIYICIYKSPRSVYFSLVITIDYNW